MAVGESRSAAEQGVAPDDRPRTAGSQLNGRTFGGRKDSQKGGSMAAGERSFHPAPAPTQEDVEAIVERASKRILRFLQRRGVITLVTAPGDGEVTVVTDEAIGDKDPLLARLLAAATAGAPPAGLANKRKPIRIVFDPDAHPVAKGNLCGQHAGFNLHAATRVVANDKKGRETLCKYILRPPLANDRLHILPDGNVRLEFKRAWSDGTSSIELEPLALVARLAALVPPPRRHVTRYSGVLSSHSSLRSQCVPAPVPESTPEEEDKPSRTLPLSHYISWSQLLRRTFDLPINYSAHRGSDRSSSGHPPVPPEVRAGTRRDCSPIQLG